MDQPKLPDRDGAAGLARLDYTIEPSLHRVKDLPDMFRPREEMERCGAENVPGWVLLAVILRGGVHGANVVDLATGLLKRYGSFTELAGATVDELAAIKGIGRVKAQVLKAALEVGRRLGAEALPRKLRVRSPQDTVGILAREVRLRDQEVFWALLLDAKNYLACEPVNVSSGILDASLVHPREVFRAAVRAATAAVVLVHNHPSGDPTPSAEDIRITRQLVEAGRVLDIKVLDHVIIAKPVAERGRAFISLREEGIVDFA